MKIPDIAALTGMEEANLRNRMYAEGWQQELSREEQKMLRRIVRSKKEKIESIIDNTLSLVDSQVKQIRRDKPNLTPRALKDLTGVLLDVDKVMRLDGGMATEIHANIQLNHENLVELMGKIITLDPGVDYGVVTLNDETNSSGDSSTQEVSGGSSSSEQALVSAHGSEESSTSVLPESS